MIRLLQCEYKKTRGRYLFLTALAITAVELVWTLYGDYNEFAVRNGWMMFLYQLPLTNTIFMPMLSMVVASRLCDIEHKGAMLKQLLVIARKGKVFDAKFIYGVSIILFCNMVNWCVTVCFGYLKGFEGDVPVKLYLLYFLFTAVPSIAVYIIQHTLALLFKNQAVTFFTGIIGTFAGLFSMFLPQYPILRKMIPWGYYGVLQFVGMYGWTQETRYEYAYFEIMGFDWLFFWVLAAAIIVMYLIGRALFCRKEV